MRAGVVRILASLLAVSQIGVSSRIDARASRRNDTLEGPGSVGDLLPDPVAPVTVTETVRQTVTVNGGDAAEGFNATATETVTMTILADDGLLDDQAFEGIRISVTTTTVRVRGPATTITEGATVVQTITEAVTEQGPPVVETITEACEPQVSTVTVTAAATCEPVNVEAPPIAAPAPDAPIEATTNSGGNGVGVVTVPIADSMLPQTTLTYDPLASSAPAPLEPAPAPPVETPDPAPAPAPPVATPDPAPEPAPTPEPTPGEPAALPPVETPTVVSTTAAITTTETSPAPTPTEPAPTPPADSVQLSSGLDLGGVESAIQTPAESETTTAAQPVVDLDGMSLSSQLDLGNLLKARATA